MSVELDAESDEREAECEKQCDVSDSESDEREAECEKQCDVSDAESDETEAECEKQCDVSDAESDERKAECEKQCDVSDVALSDVIISVKLNIETEQLHSASVARIYSASATDNTEIPDTSVRRSAEISDRALCAVDRAKTVLCAVDRAELAHSVDVSTACMTHDVSDTSADVALPLCTSVTSTALSVLNKTQHSMSHSKPVTAATVAAPVTLLHDISDGRVSLPSMSVDGSDRSKVKKSYKRCRKAEQRKQKNENVCYAGSGLRKVKRKAARLVAVDVEDDSSG